MSHVAALTVSTLAAASAARATVQWARNARQSHRPILVGAPQSTNLRVALFSGNYNCVRDGANQALNRLVAHLIEAEGAEVRVFSPVIDNPAFSPAGQLSGVPSIPIPGRSEYRLALGFPKALREELSLFSPGLIHVSAPDLLGRAAEQYAIRNRIPLIASLHTRFETYFEYYGLGLLRAGAEHWLRRFYDACDCILVPTTAIQRDLDRWGLAGRTRIWSRGVDPTRFSLDLRDLQWRRSQGYDDSDVVPLFLGRLVREKGLGCFAEAIALARQRGYRVRPLIVGDGPARGWLAERLPNAVFVGHLHGVELGRAVASADILINPSLTEAFGNVTLEAMASGLAVICPDVGSTRDLIRLDWSGLLVDADPKGFADGLARLIDAPDQRLAMGRAASFASAGYSWARVNASVVECYRDVLGHQTGDAATKSEVRSCEN